MGEIGEEELTKWEKMQMEMSSGGEEKIVVLIRLRPLNEREIAKNDVSVWECINESTILFRNSLQERSMFPSAYTFDRVFGGDSPTSKVYVEGAKEIALSAVSGVNSSIFAYGQTSSGKTYTMNGITEYTVADIYDYIQRHEERAFVLKFCAMEIYNEAIRDLLSTDSTSLRVLDDPEKGTVVENITEETLRDCAHLKELLSICEAQRRIGETSLNETSSRSHQILRLTIESSAREFLGKDNSTTLAASVNFVDLAGSERASQAYSVGARLKEGCHINRSLLALSTVIRKLSKERHGHVNYRDSKLTRILEPCLGGNARTAIICTLSPARSHVEHSRNSLLFASCAKEVGTNAKVNVVMSDKALVKHLQKELARLERELRTPVPSSICDYASLVRKKDLQIEKLEKEVREQTKQRELAELRVQELLQKGGSDEDSRQCEGNKWEDECSVSASSVMDDRYYRDTGGETLSNAQSSNRKYIHNYEKPYPKLPRNEEEDPLSKGTGEDPNDICREVRCIEMDESRKDKIREPLTLSTGNAEGMHSNMTNDEMEATPTGQVTETESRTTYGLLGKRLQDLRKTIDSLVSPYPGDPSPRDQLGSLSSCKSRKLSRSWSCKANLMDGSSLPYFETTGENQNTPVSGLEKSFPGRPEGFQRMVSPFSSNATGLLRNDSQSFVGSTLLDELKAQKNNSAEEDISTVGTSVAGLKEIDKLESEEQVADCQGTESKANKNVKNIGLDPVLDTSETPATWHIEFVMRQKAILELWQSCNISLVHRTYFFLLFKGDPADSIYMEVELRRLSFLKEAFSQSIHAVEGGQTLTTASSDSLKSLRREREMLTELIHKRFSETERNRLYQKWGIRLSSKRRRFQLVNRLWSDTRDINHVAESASIVGKLMRFGEQGNMLKEMFGLSFTHTRASRRSFGRKHSISL